MKHSFVVILTIILCGMTVFLYAQSGEPWISTDLLEPAALSAMLKNPQAPMPVIFNIGPVADIKGAINIGSTSNKANLKKLSKSLINVPPEKMVVIYCGCCPFRHCPNIRPAFRLLKERGFKHPKLLNLKQNVKVDWTDYGYPME